MNLDEFDRHLSAARINKPTWFEMVGERPCSDAEILALEQKLRVQLPNEYKAYLAKYGGGYVGHISVFSARAESEWYLPKGNRFVPPELNFIAVTDDETGGYYGFKVDDDGCSDSVHYWHFEDGDAPTFKANSFLDYVVAVGLPGRW